MNLLKLINDKSIIADKRSSIIRCNGTTLTVCLIILSILGGLTALTLPSSIRISTGMQEMCLGFSSESEIIDIINISKQTIKADFY